MNNVLPVTDESFNLEVLDSQVPVLVEFGAAWCGPCKKQLPVLQELASEYSSQLKVVKADIDDCPEAATKYSIRNIPTMILFKSGQPVDGKIVTGLHSLSQLKKLLSE